MAMFGCPIIQSDNESHIITIVSVSGQILVPYSCDIGVEKEVYIQIVQTLYQNSPKLFSSSGHYTIGF